MKKRNDNSYQDTLYKRAGSKFLSNSIALTCYRELKNHLADHDTGQVFLKEVKKILNCGDRIATGDENTKVKTHFCKSRMCLVCNRNRAGQLINRYGERIDGIEEKKFITLSLRNCRGEHLRNNINFMYEGFRRIRRNLKKTYLLKVEYIKKLEVTQNENFKNYHPHFHILIQDERIDITYKGQKFLSLADLIREMWLQQFPGQTSEKAQKVVSWTYGKGQELFKYFTKFITKDKYSTEKKPVYKLLQPRALMTIHSAISGKRIFETSQYFRKLEVKKTLKEVSAAWKKQAERLAWLNFNTEQNHSYYYDFNQRNYINSDTGEFLTNYKPSEFLTKNMREYNYSINFISQNYQPFKFHDRRPALEILGQECYFDNPADLEILRLIKILDKEKRRGAPFEDITALSDKIYKMQNDKFEPDYENNTPFAAGYKKILLHLSHSDNKKYVYQKYKIN